MEWFGPKGKINNMDIKLRAAGSGIPLWKIAEELGIADSSLSRKLRKELPEAEKQRIFDIIERLAAGNDQV